MGTLTLTDAESTPVNRSYVGVSSSPDLAIWKDYATNSNYNLGAGVASVSVKENADGTVRVRAKLVTPILEVVDGDDSAGFVPPPKKAFEMISETVFVFPGRTSLQQRKNQRALQADLVGDAVMTAAIETFTRPTA